MRDEAIFRSAQMSLAQMYVSYEVSREIVRALGDLGVVHFRDLNASVSDFQRAFVEPIKSVNNSLRQTRLVKSYMQTNGVEMAPVWSGEQVANIETLPAKLDALEDQLTNLVDSELQLKSSQLQLIERRYTLQFAAKLLGQHHAVSDTVLGVVNRQELAALQRICWRALRGNLVFMSENIDQQVWDSSQRKLVDKSVFVVVTHGSQLLQRAESIARAMDAHVYEIQNSDVSHELQDLNTRLSEVNEVLEQTHRTLISQLQDVSESIGAWDLALQKERGVYETLNKFVYDENRKLLIAEGWIPTDELINTQNCLRSVSEAFQVESPTVMTLLQTTKQPPTYHRTNKVTQAFQNMVDVYAVASYQEVNPGLPTVVTFPFMFAVMFGDIGHGFLMFLAALLVVLNERKLARYQGGDVFDMFYTGRYVILLMGLFSMFTGFMYNDLFSKSMTLFKSGWVWPHHESGESVTAVSTNNVYIFGIDYMWHGAENNLRFLNSYKMKLSVILGYVHMLYSYFFSLVNDLHFKNYAAVLTNFVPGLIFFLSIFGYLSICIIYKWTVDWAERGAQPPSLMNMLINMFLAPGKIDEPLYKGQKQVQLFLLFAALASVPVLLFAKPLYMRRQAQKQHHQNQNQYQALPTVQPQSSRDNAVSDRLVNDALQNLGSDSSAEEHEESFGDIMIEQAIETIEFCLNSVSHTASYLRLWALSLAHSQLSQVLWDMTLKLSFGASGTVGVIMVVVMFAVWMSLTVAILTVMEGTSAMLHALRLHWVESMSKFYIGEGYAFEPFSFASLSAAAA
ncbi:H(+)-transporting V0 sector ATPase subunit A [Starmerella bacillaris]|uniref:V-type proton ATPase subunit a n=1 Tax=Starmerella bacillaris TaxID=1247836 RepID=A0AAV5RI62_STABA|nr:H(+)-transporting V0 sector ATPase subunit A [Starmerella bacillaris]